LICFVACISAQPYVRFLNALSPGKTIQIRVDTMTGPYIILRRGQITNYASYPEEKLQVSITQVNFTTTLVNTSLLVYAKNYSTVAVVELNGEVTVIDYEDNFQPDQATVTNRTAFIRVIDLVPNTEMNVYRGFPVNANSTVLFDNLGYLSVTSYLAVDRKLGGLGILTNYSRTPAPVSGQVQGLYPKSLSTIVVMCCGQNGFPSASLFKDRMLDGRIISNGLLHPVQAKNFTHFMIMDETLMSNDSSVNIVNGTELPANVSATTSTTSTTSTASTTDQTTSGMPITSNAVTSAAVTSSPITSSPVTSSPITSNAMTTSHITSAALTTSKLTTASMTTAHGSTTNHVTSGKPFATTHNVVAPTTHVATTEAASSKSTTSTTTGHVSDASSERMPLFITVIAILFSLVAFFDRLQ